MATAIFKAPKVEGRKTRKKSSKTAGARKPQDSHQNRLAEKRSPVKQILFPSP
jgi:hypothetical protein